MFAEQIDDLLFLNHTDLFSADIQIKRFYFSGKLLFLHIIQFHCLIKVFSAPHIPPLSEPSLQDQQNDQHRQDIRHIDPYPLRYLHPFSGIRLF